MPNIKRIKIANINYDFDSRYIELSRSTSGTLTAEQISVLQSSTRNYINHDGTIFKYSGGDFPSYAIYIAESADKETEGGETVEYAALARISVDLTTGA